MKKKVLIIEDEEILRDLCARKLFKSGFEVCEFEKGNGALDEIKRILPDIILLDVMLPGMNGFEILRRIRNAGKKIPILEKIPVLMFTNLGQEADMKKAKKLGADGFVVKANFTIKEIVEKIKQLVK